MSKERNPKQTAQLLKTMREQRQETVQRTQELIKEQIALRKPIRQALEDAGAQTIPQLAEKTGLPAHEVLWHISAMKKRNLVVETGKDGEYYQYQLASGSTR
jgi:predicted transcriptional regulator